MWDAGCGEGAQGGGREDVARQEQQAEQRKGSLGGAGEGPPSPDTDAGPASPPPRDGGGGGLRRGAARSVCAAGRLGAVGHWAGSRASRRRRCHGDAPPREDCAARRAFCSAARGGGSSRGSWGRVTMSGHLLGRGRARAGRTPELHGAIGAVCFGFDQILLHLLQLASFLEEE